MLKRSIRPSLNAAIAERYPTMVIHRRTETSHKVQIHPNQQYTTEVYFEYGGEFFLSSTESRRPFTGFGTIHSNDHAYISTLQQLCNIAYYSLLSAPLGLTRQSASARSPRRAGFQCVQYTLPNTCGIMSFTFRRTRPSSPFSLS